MAVSSSSTPAPPGILVLGMHRSGTSTASRAVNLLGVPAGPPSALKVAKPENPRGFWEVSGLTRFNDELLHTLGGGWAGPPERAAILQVADDAARHDDARAVFDTVFAGRGSWVWKDPRVCVLLPFWHRVLGRRPAAVLVHRNPLEIAQSLQVRDGFPKALALALWERCVHDALIDSVGTPVLVQRYEDLAARPEAAHARLGAFLARHDIPRPEPSRETLRAFADPSLRHALATAQEFRADPVVTGSQRRLFDVVEELDGEHDALPETMLGAMNQESRLLLAHSGRAQAQIAAQQLEVEEALRQAKQARALAKEARLQAKAARRAERAAQAQVSELEAELERRKMRASARWGF